MQALYESVIALLEADDDLGVQNSLATLLGVVVGSDDTRIYKTSVQVHNQAANSGLAWITVNKLSSVAEPIEQIQDVKIIEFAVHVWVRDDSSEYAELITERVQDLLDGVDLATAKLLAWYCHWVGTSAPSFEPEMHVWHFLQRFECEVCLVDDL